MSWHADKEGTDPAQPSWRSEPPAPSVDRACKQPPCLATCVWRYVMGMYWVCFETCVYRFWGMFLGHVFRYICGHVLFMCLGTCVGMCWACVRYVSSKYWALIGYVSCTTLNKQNYSKMILSSISDLHYQADGYEQDAKVDRS